MYNIIYIQRLFYLFLWHHRFLRGTKDILEYTSINDYAVVQWCREKFGQGE